VSGNPIYWTSSVDLTPGSSIETGVTPSFTPGCSRYSQRGAVVDRRPRSLRLPVFSAAS
jgi:hypothetical protein